jgi:hypothetical protein
LLLFKSAKRGSLLDTKSIAIGSFLFRFYENGVT